jgi:hypothetical protein
MEDDRVPQPEPSGALVPPPVYPRTALATAAPLPPRRRDDDDVTDARGVFVRALDRTFDALDTVGDRIAQAVGLR